MGTSYCLPFRLSVMVTVSLAMNSLLASLDAQLVPFQVYVIAQELRKLGLWNDRRPSTLGSRRGIWINDDNRTHIQSNAVWQSCATPQASFVDSPRMIASASETIPWTISAAGRTLRTSSTP